MDDEYGELLDGPAPGGEGLRAIVERAQRSRRRAVVVAAAGAGVLALVAGGAGSWALWGQKAKGQTVVAAPAAGGNGAAANTPAQAGSSTASPGISSDGTALPSTETYTSAETLTTAFERTVGVIAIRAFDIAGVYEPDMACGPPLPQLQVEVSNPGMVTTAIGFAGGSGAILSAEGSVEGALEHDPVDLVVVHVAPTVSAVRFDFTATSTATGQAATDEMSPVGGWAVLAAPAAAKGSSTLGTLHAINAAGKTVKSLSVDTDSGFPSFGYGSTSAAGSQTCVCTTPTQSVSIPTTGQPGSTIPANQTSSGGATGPAIAYCVAEGSGTSSGSGSVSGGGSGSGGSSGTSGSGSSGSGAVPPGVPSNPSSQPPVTASPGG